MPESDSIERVTEALAQVLCGDSSSLLTVANLARGLQAPDQSVLAFSPAEGFAYYALHPLDFSQLPQPILADSRPAAVIGIRSIGTTLSAIVTAALRQRSRPAERITVRPTGHPYERVTRFSREQNAWIERHNSGGADFLVVDEGPGRSGSSFLSVGEELVRAGVESSRIFFVGSREMFEAMNRAITLHQMRPVVDRVFPMAEIRQALEYMESGAHFGKICLRM